MEPCDEIRHDCEGRFEALEAWQGRQNGSLQRIDSKVDKLMFAVVTAALACIGSLVLLTLNLAKGCL